MQQTNANSIDNSQRRIDFLRGIRLTKRPSLI